MYRLFYIFLLFFSTCIYSQVTIIPLLDKDKNNIPLDEPFILTFLVKVKGKIQTESPLYLPDFSKFQIIGSASNRNTTVIGNEVVDEKIYQWKLKPLHPGKIKIGAVKVTVNGQDFYTEPFDIQVNDGNLYAGKSIEKKSKTYMEVEVVDKQIYQNQSTIAFLRVYSTNIHQLKKIKNIHFEPQDNFEIKEFTHVKSDVEVTHPKIVSQVVAEFVLMPLKKGNVELPRASARIAKGEKIKTKPEKINIKPLPKNKPKGFSNAVGKDFEMKIISENKEKLIANEPIKVKVKLKGKGNISHLKLPKIKTNAEVDIYEPKTSFQQSNLNANMVVEYVIIPKKAGNLKLTTEHFVYFNPTTQKYVKLPSPYLELKIKSREEISEEPSPFAVVNSYTNNVLETVDNPVLETDKLKVGKNEKFHWETILINGLLVIVFLVLFLFFRKWQKNKLKNTNNIPSQSLGSVEESEKEIKKMLENNIQDDFLFLKKMKEERKYNAFFDAIQDLELKLKEMYQVSDFQDFINDKIGETGMTEYRNLQERIQIQKYSPVQNENEINTIYELIVKLYSKISK